MTDQNANPLHDLVQHALDQDYNKANSVFNDMMTVKLNDILDQKKVEVAGQIYNGLDAEEIEDENVETDSTEELETDDEESDESDSGTEEDEEDDS